MTAKYFGGIEGGATHSQLVICNDDGELVSSIDGPGTNHWMLGIAECARRIAEMVNQGKEHAKIPLSTQLVVLGLSLSGCEQEATNSNLEKELKQKHPDVAAGYVVCSDTVGSIYTACPVGGMVVISGTGSNALLQNKDGSSYGCGGWGNVLGDEGSAWWISHRAMKIVFDDHDNFVEPPHPTERVWELIKLHFSVETRLDLLDHCYARFDKPFFAGLCKKLAMAAEEGDPMSIMLFTEAGRLLARSIMALLPRVDEDLVCDGDLSVVCVGSVWLSWNLLKIGFLKELNAANVSYGIKLISLTKTMAWGAVYLAADSVQFDLPREYANNYEVFHRFSKTADLNGKS